MGRGWTRRQFLAESAALAAAATRRLGLGREAAAQVAAPQSAARSPEEITGQVSGLMEGQTSRPLRYRPVDGGFVIRNGREFFNRPLYGPNNAFRVDAGDLPEFSLYLPGHGGNLRLGVIRGTESKWLAEATEVVAAYRDGRMLYEVRDGLVHGGALRVEALTVGSGSGLHVRVVGDSMSAGTKLLWAFGGVSGKKGRRGGDIGCEVEPVSQFFQVRPEECKGNVYSIEGAVAKLRSAAASLRMDFPQGSELRRVDGRMWNEGWERLWGAADPASDAEMLVGLVEIGTEPLHLVVRREVDGTELAAGVFEVEFAERRTALDAIASRIAVQTPDEYVNAMGGALGIAGDAIWDDTQRCVMHGAVAWRNALAGWRGPYVLDALGWHDRFREHARHWIGKQNVSSVTTGSPAVGGPDPKSHMSRSENLLHSRGDISKNHYDMNLVFFDAVLRHLQWTGDKSLAAVVWPALEMHLEWERRMFRRSYMSTDGRELPLYEGYACIWASDNLQYNGGGAAHSTAYNYFANKRAAEVARWIGKDATAYERESELILAGMRDLLWMKSPGTFGESKDLWGPQTVYASPALWTVYHTIDSEVATPREAWQMCMERLAALRHVPVHGNGVPDGEWYMLSCSDWMPYVWSLNLLLLGENMHMALALWQAGMVEEAFAIFKGNVLDSMYMGLAPGNFHMTSALDVHRQEAQRDFGDPIGTSSRALVEGLFGVRPNLVRDVVTIAPGFPKGWDRASLKHRDFDLIWKREGDRDSFEVGTRFGRPVRLVLRLRASRAGRPLVRVNGAEASGRFDGESVGTPVFVVECAAGQTWKVEVEWNGEVVDVWPARRRYFLGDVLALPARVGVGDLDDPQACLKSGRVAVAGAHTVFARMRREDCEWWMPISFEVMPAVRAAGADRVAADAGVEMVDLSGVLRHSVTEIFQRKYDAPRSKFCSLSIPEQGAGGWAAFDTQPEIDDAGLRAMGGVLRTPMGVAFKTPAEKSAANCLFLSYWEQDKASVEVPLKGRAKRLFMLMVGSTFPQCSRMTHAVVRVRYRDGTESALELRNPETWWPIEQDYLLDDYLFVSYAAIPPRVDLKTGQMRILDPVSFKGRGRTVPGGAANVLEIPLDDSRELASMRIEVKLYGVVVGLMAATLVR